MPDELRLGLRVLAFAQAGEVLRADRRPKAPTLGKLALPFAVTLLFAAPVVLLLGGELLRVVRAGLAGGKWFRDGKHQPIRLLQAFPTP